jgi:3'5'-cyclic nucleotide phosphodiesterase
VKIVGESGEEAYNGQSLATCSFHSSSADDGTDTADRLSAEITATPRFSMLVEKEEHDRVPVSDTRSDRLIDWNVEVLMGFLEKVVQNRNPTTEEELYWTKPPCASRGLVIDEVVEVIALPAFANGVRVKRSSRLAKVLPSVVRTQLKEFVSGIASMYRNVPFHNFEHASHVTMSANKLMKRIITPDDNVAASEKPLRPRELHRSTFGISSDPLTQFAVVFAALIHDVDHTGLSNTTLVEKGFAVARIFQNKSVAEQNSVVVAWDFLMQPQFSDLQMCIFPCESDQKRFRQLIVNAVMATDIMDRDMLALRKKRWEKAFDSFGDTSDDEEKHDVHRKATIVIEHIIQASDVAHTMQHWHIYLKWNTRLYKELYRSYKNGFLGKDPTHGWYEGELGFFDHYVIPLAKKLKECGVFNVSGDEYLQYAEWNRQEWEQKGREETRKMVLSREDEDDQGDFPFAFDL